MLRVKRGDRAAFAELVEKYKQPVMNFVFRTLRDEIEAEDLAQNVFLQVYKSRAATKRTAKFSTWLFTIARNLCLNEIRRRSRHPAESLEEAHAEHEDQPRQQYEDKAASRRRKIAARRTGAKNRGGAGRTCRKTSAPPFCSAGRTS
jgi:RNA polymerase sigma-70 factor, ECF subfamily